jgi:hypothetical protein
MMAVNLVFSSRNARKVAKDIEGIERAAKKLPEGFIATKKEAKELERAHKRLMSAIITPQEKFNEKLRMTARLLAAKKIGVGEARRAVTKYREELNLAERGGRQAFGAAMVRQLSGYVMGLASVTGAISFIRAELQAMEADQRRMTEANITAESARANLKKNIVSFSKAEKKEIEATSEAISRRQNIEQRYVNQALAQAISATDKKSALSLTELAIMVNKESPETAGAFAGSLADVSGALGDPRGKRALGFLLAAGAKSRVVDFAKQAENIPAAVASAVASGATPEEAAALFGSFGKRATDVQGRSTRTAVTQVTGKLKTFFDAQVEQGKFVAEDVDTFSERRQMLIQNEGLRKKFLKTAGGEERFKVAVSELFDPTSQTSQMFREIIPTLGTERQQMARAGELISDLRQGPEAGARRLNQSVDAAADRFARGVAPVLLDEREEKLIALLARARGQTYMGTRLLEGLAYGMDYTAEEAIQTIRSTERMQDFGSLRGDPGALTELRAIREELERNQAAPAGRAE